MSRCHEATDNPMILFNSSRSTPAPAPVNVMTPSKRAAPSAANAALKSIEVVPTRTCFTRCPSSAIHSADVSDPWSSLALIETPTNGEFTQSTNPLDSPTELNAGDWQKSQATVMPRCSA